MPGILLFYELRLTAAVAKSGINQTLMMVQTCHGSIAPPVATLLALSVHTPGLGGPLHQVGELLSKRIADRWVELREQAWRPWSMDLCIKLGAGTCFSLH